MISYIIGKLTYKDNGRILIENNGIGYEIFASDYTIKTLPIVGADAQVYTFMSVREDGISLIGFSSLDEKGVFEKLLTVSGIGPKVALGILSGINYNDLLKAILNEDTKTISGIKGIGKKTSERIIVELKDNVSSSDLVFSKNDSIQLPTDIIDDAVSTLMALGLNKNEALALVRGVATTEDTLEDIIQKSLKGLGR